MKSCHCAAAKGSLRPARSFAGPRRNRILSRIGLILENNVGVPCLKRWTGERQWRLAPVRTATGEDLRVTPLEVQSRNKGTIWSGVQLAKNSIQHQLLPAQDFNRPHARKSHGKTARRLLNSILDVSARSTVSLLASAYLKPICRSVK